MLLPFGEAFFPLVCAFLFGRAVVAYREMRGECGGGQLKVRYLRIGVRSLVGVVKGEAEETFLDGFKSAVGEGDAGIALEKDDVDRGGRIALGQDASGGSAFPTVSEESRSSR